MTGGRIHSTRWLSLEKGILQTLGADESDADFLKISGKKVGESWNTYKVDQGPSKKKPCPHAPPIFPETTIDRHRSMGRPSELQV